MFWKIATHLVAFLAAASAVNAIVVPQSLSNLDATASTASSLTLAVKVTLSAAPEDAGRSIDFTFGNADATLTFGSGKIVIPANIPAGGIVTVTGTGTYSPASTEAKIAGEAVLSAYASNTNTAISVTAPDGVFKNILLAAPGSEIVQRLNLYVDVQTIVRQVGNVTFVVANPFSLPLTFTSLNANASAPLGGVQTLLGTINQNPLATPIVIPPGSTITSGNVTTAIKLTLAQGLQLITALQGGKSVNTTTDADANVLIGDYASAVALRKKIIPAFRAV
ncbi:hypothetical protein BJ742DRAFT_902130 [Cladochytrium replicatum]|nr:hypothetical protein BJ742DRAFT_902130 [Cladochytrium replicatum]